MIIVIIAELSGRLRQSPIVLGGGGGKVKFLVPFKDILSTGPVDFTAVKRVKFAKVKRNTSKLGLLLSLSKV